MAFSHPGQISEVPLQTFNTIMMINRTLTECLVDHLLQFLSILHRQENQSSVLSHSLKPNVYLVTRGNGGAQEHKGENGNNLQGKHPHTPVLLQNSEQSVHSLKPLVVWKHSCILQTAEETVCNVPLLAPYFIALPAFCSSVLCSHWAQSHPEVVL